jgi:hypothetical protein
METWRLKAKAITKYNPKNFNSEGVYLLDEWTSRADIGKKIDSYTGVTLSKERYLQVENNYIKSVRVFVKNLKVKKIRIKEFYYISNLEDFEENNDKDLYEYFKSLESKVYDVEEIENIVRLALREYIQVEIKLITPDETDAVIHFGYDYYMYFVCDTLDFNWLQKKLNDFQMFVT